MNRFLTGLLALTMVFSLSACGNREEEVDPEKELKSQVWADVAVECKFSYQNVKNVTTNLVDIQEDDDIYTVKGKVTILDSYGDTYSGNFDAEYEYKEMDNSFRKINLEIDHPTKD